MDIGKSEVNKKKQKKTIINLEIFTMAKINHNKIFLRFHHREIELFFFIFF